MLSETNRPCVLGQTLVTFSTHSSRWASFRGKIHGEPQPHCSLQGTSSGAPLRSLKDNAKDLNHFATSPAMPTGREHREAGGCGWGLVLGLRWGHFSSSPHPIAVQTAPIGGSGVPRVCFLAWGEMGFCAQPHRPLSPADRALGPSPTVNTCGWPPKSHLPAEPVADTPRWCQVRP